MTMLMYTVATLFILSLMYYYMFVLLTFLHDKYSFRSEILLDLIPYRMWVISMCEKWRRLE